MAKSLLEQTTDPSQYDRIRWEELGGEDAPFRVQLRFYLEGSIEDLSGKTVLDIGSGAGHWFNFLKKHGASRVVGIEPSKRNIRLARQTGLDFEIINSALQDAQIQEQFDAVFSVYVLDYVPDVCEAFRKILSLLKIGCFAYIIVADKEYQLTDRFDYRVESSPIDDDQVAVVTHRSSGTWSYVARAPGYYVERAQDIGLGLHKHVPLRFTEEYLAAEPKFREVADKVFAHLFVFRKP